MVTFGTTRFGQDGRTTSPVAGDQALFLKVFAGDVLLAFERHTVTDGRVRMRTIQSGKSAQFPVFGAASSGFHIPGQNLITEGGATPTFLSQPLTSEKIIVIDGILQSSVLINDIDEAMNHVDVRGPFAREMGWALAKEFDVRNLMAIFFGSTVVDTFSGDSSDWGAGKTRQIVDATFDTSATTAKATIASIAQLMTESDVPEEGRHIAVRPDTYSQLAQDTTVTSSDFNRNTGGDLGTKTILRYQGISIHESNRIADVAAKGNLTAPESSEQHSAEIIDDYSRCLAVAWQEEQSVGVVKLRNLEMQMQYKLEYIGTLMVAGYSAGHGVLHESACFSVIEA